MKWLGVMALAVAGACGGSRSAVPAEPAAPAETRPAAPASAAPAEAAGPREGLRVVYTLAGGERSPAVLERARRVIEARLRGWGAPAPWRVRVVGATLEVELSPGDVQTIERVKDVIARRARFEVLAVADGTDWSRDLHRRVSADARARDAGIEARDDSWSHAGTARADHFLVAADRVEPMSEEQARERGCWHRDIRVIGGQVECRVSGRSRIERYLEASGLGAPAGHAVGFEQQPPSAWRSYLLATEVLLDNDAIATATAAGGVVKVGLTERGAARLAQATTRHQGRKLAFVVDDVIVAAPIVVEAIHGGAFALPAGTRAYDVAVSLGHGSLPAALVEQSSSVIAADDGGAVAP